MISELLYNGIDLIVALIIVALYWLEVPFVQQYLWEIFLGVFGVRYFCDFFFMKKRFQKEGLAPADGEKSGNQAEGEKKASKAE
jgi:hypothetical protein